MKIVLDQNQINLVQSLFDTVYKGLDDANRISSERVRQFWLGMNEGVFCTLCSLGLSGFFKAEGAE